MIYHFVSALGFLVFAGIAWLLSTDRRKIAWKTIAWGVSLQLVIGLLIFQFPGTHRIFLWLNDAVLALLDASKSGTAFLFGPLAASPGEPGSVGFILLFQVLPVAIFFAAFTAVLYYLRVLQWVVRLFARVFHRTMEISGAESLCGAANIFVGVESALVIRPYLDKMTRSELLTVLTTGMATVASSTLGIYVAFLTGVFPQIAGHLLSASVSRSPRRSSYASCWFPKPKRPKRALGVPEEDESTRPRNLMSAIIEGSMDGLKLAAGISALLIAILGLVALGDKMLGFGSSWFGMTEPLSLVRILSWVFRPFAYLLGIQSSDIPIAAKLVGRASDSDRGCFIQRSRSVDFERRHHQWANGGDSELRVMRIRARGIGGDLRRWHGGARAEASRRSCGARMASVGRGDACDIDDRLHCGDLQQRRRHHAVEMSNLLARSLAVR